MAPDLFNSTRRMRGSNSRLPGLAGALTYSVGLSIHYECAGVLVFSIYSFIISNRRISGSFALSFGVDSIELK